MVLCFLLLFFYIQLAPVWNVYVVLFYFLHILNMHTQLKVHIQTDKQCIPKGKMDVIPVKNVLNFDMTMLSKQVL